MSPTVNGGCITIRVQRIDRNCLGGMQSLWQPLTRTVMSPSVIGGGVVERLSVSSDRPQS